MMVPRDKPDYFGVLIPQFALIVLIWWMLSH